MAYKVTVMNQAVGVVLETVVQDLTEIPDEISHMANAIEQATKPVCPQCDGLGLDDGGVRDDPDPIKCGRCAGKGRLGMKPIPPRKGPADPPPAEDITSRVTKIVGVPIDETLMPEQAAREFYVDGVDTRPNVPEAYGDEEYEEAFRQECHVIDDEHVPHPFAEPIEMPGADHMPDGTVE